MPDALLFSGVAALAQRLRSRELSPMALAERCLARLGERASRLGCFVTVAAERALEDARTAEAEIAAGRWRGPLHGIPCGLADAVDTRGIRTTFGAAPHAARVPARDATVARRLAEAGAVLVGKLSTLELGGGLGVTTAAAALDGPCRNPWDLGRWAGGASSGAGAAVASGLVPFAIGVETWRASTSPAAFCGVTGLRPTYGVLSRHGVMTRAYTLDAVGPVARTAEDCALVLRALAGVDPRDPSSIAAPAALERVRPEVPRGLRIAVVGAGDGARLSPAAREAFARAQEPFRAAGALLEETALPELPYEALVAVLDEAESASAFEELIRSGRTRLLADPSHAGKRPEDYRPAGSSADYVRAMRLRGDVQRALSRFFTRHDLVLAPSAARPPAVEERLDALLALPDPVGAAASAAGLPAVTVPAGFADGLPLALHLLAPPLEEARLLSAAALFQARTDHHLARPPDPGAAPSAAARSP